MFFSREMSKNHEHFHPRLLITEHFSNIINQIDVKTETLLDNQMSNKESRKKINKLRKDQIEKIKEIEQINLNHLPSEIDVDKYEQKWSHILKDASLNYQKKIDLIKEQEDLIHFDCVLFEQPKILNGLELWVTSWFYNQRNLEFLRLFEFF